jgi:hypothetical protein
MVEFAFSLGIFLAVTVGIIFVCMALLAYEYADFASREATRWASVRGSDCVGMPNCDADQTAIQNYVRGLNYPVVIAGDITVNVTWLQANGTRPQTWTACSGQCNARGNEVQVQVSYPFLMAIPFVASNTLNISSTSTMVISQ